MATHITKPKKYLEHSDDHFQGYWVQLQSLIRQNDAADEMLDGLLVNPLEILIKAVDCWEGQSEPDNPEEAELWAEYKIAKCIKTLYVAGGYGDPKGTFPPKLEELQQDPMKHIKDWTLATQRGTKGGKNERGANCMQARLWVKREHQNVKQYRTACKYIWETCVATLKTGNATTIIAGLPYGNGPMLLKQIEGQQQRQTTMALFTLFSKLITIKFGDNEKLRSMFASIMQIKTRLQNWDPPSLVARTITYCLPA